MPADLEKFVVDSLPEFLLLVASPGTVFAVGDAVRSLRSVVVCYDAQHFYKNVENLGQNDASVDRAAVAAPVDPDEFAAYCESKIARRFAELRDYRCCMNVSDLIRMDAWARLYAGVGQRVMKFLLFDCLLFVPLPGGGDDHATAAYYCVHAPSTAALAARHQVIRSFQTLAVKQWKVAAADRKRENGARKTVNRRPSPPARPRTCFNVAGLLSDVRPIRLADADSMFREIQSTRVTDRHDDDDDDETRLDGLKRKLNVIAAKHSLSTLRGIYTNTVGNHGAVEVPLGRVKKFAVAVARKMVPRELYGPGGNRDRYCENLCRVLDGGMHHDFTVQHVVHNIRAKRVGWLGAVAADRRPAVLARTLVWLTNAFVFARIAHFFRVVATDKPSNGIAYFAKASWEAACDAKISPLMAGVGGGGFFREIEAAGDDDAVGANRPAKYRRWKVCPYAKPNGRVRLIFKLRRRETGAEKQLTDHCLTFLRCLVRTYPAECRSVSRAQFFRGWQRLSPPLYYVRTDFRDAFTSLEQGKLLAVVRDRIRERFGDSSQSLHAHSVHVVRTGGGGTVFCKRRMFFDGLPTPEFAAGSLVFYDKTDVVPLIRIWDAVRRRVRRNAVVRRGRLWAMTRGVVQGDRLSVALCDLLLADLQASQLACFGALGSAAGLYRFVDDYVFVSPDRAEARRFLDTMVAGFDEYGLQLNRSKTETNAVDDGGGGGCTFLGFRLDAATGSVMRDESAYRGRRPLHFFDYQLGRGRPGRALFARMTRLGQHPVPAVLVSRALNTTSTAARNLASVVAYKAFAFVTAVRQYYFHLNPNHVLRTVHAVARLMYAKLYSQARRSAVTPMQCKWIVYEVYARVLRARLSAGDAHVAWIVHRLRDRQAAVGRRCDTGDLKVSLRRGYDFTKMFG